MSEKSERKNAKKLRERIDEMHVGYSNTQELIRFIDAKLTIIWSICATIVFHAVPMGSELLKNIDNTPLLCFNILICLIYIVSMGTAFWAIIIGIFGRKEQGVNTPFPHILFPIGNDCNIQQFKEKIAKRTKQDEYNEVCDQLYSVGKILEIKLNYSRLAIYSLIVQIISFLIIFTIKNTLT
jgi:hypothetical protein